MRIAPLFAAAVLTAAVGCTADPGGPSMDPVPYRSCDDARAAGAAPLHRDDPGYSSSLDRDGDGVACEADS